MFKWAHFQVEFFEEKPNVEIQRADDAIFFLVLYIALKVVI